MDFVQGEIHEASFQPFHLQIDVAPCNADATGATGAAGHRPDGPGQPGAGPDSFTSET